VCHYLALLHLCTEQHLPWLLWLAPDPGSPHDSKEISHRVETMTRQGLFAPVTEIRTKQNHTINISQVSVLTFAKFSCVISTIRL
jgi:hypothetical protein